MTCRSSIEWSGAPYPEAGRLNPFDDGNPGVQIEIHFGSCVSTFLLFGSRFACANRKWFQTEVSAATVWICSRAMRSWQVIHAPERRRKSLILPASWSLTGIQSKDKGCEIENRPEASGARRKRTPSGGFIAISGSCRSNNHGDACGTVLEVCPRSLGQCRSHPREFGKSHAGVIKRLQNASAASLSSTIVVRSGVEGFTSVLNGCPCGRLHGFGWLENSVPMGIQLIIL
jgi:hypothetical protein